LCVFNGSKTISLDLLKSHSALEKQLERSDDIKFNFNKLATVS